MAGGGGEEGVGGGGLRRGGRANISSPDNDQIISGIKPAAFKIFLYRFIKGIRSRNVNRHNFSKIIPLN